MGRAPALQCSGAASLASWFVGRKASPGIERAAWSGHSNRHLSRPGSDAYNRAVIRGVLICGLLLLGCGSSDQPPGGHDPDAGVGDAAPDGTTNDPDGSSSCAWATQSIQPFLEGVVRSSLVIDAAGLHVSFVSATDGALGFATRASEQAWTTATIDPFAAGAAHSTLVRDSAGGLHITYAVTTAGELRYAYKPANGTWTKSTIDPFADGVGHSALVVDASDGLHVTYPAGGELRYAYKPAGRGRRRPSIRSLPVPSTPRSSSTRPAVCTSATRRARKASCATRTSRPPGRGRRRRSIRSPMARRTRRWPSTPRTTCTSCTARRRPTSSGTPSAACDRPALYSTSPVTSR